MLDTYKFHSKIYSVQLDSIVDLGEVYKLL